MGWVFCDDAVTGGELAQPYRDSREPWSVWAGVEKVLKSSPFWLPKERSSTRIPPTYSLTLIAGHPAQNSSPQPCALPNSCPPPRGTLRERWVLGIQHSGNPGCPGLPQGRCSAALGLVADFDRTQGLEMRFKHLL